MHKKHMNSPRVQYFFSQKYSLTLSLLVLLMATLLTACASKDVPQSELSKRFERDFPEEVILPPRRPADDGSGFTAAEDKILSIPQFALETNMTPLGREDVALHFKFFTHQARGTFERYLKRAEVYLPYVQSVFRENGIPEEIAYLAFVESGFNPNAVSRAGAAGLWQFMPATGTSFGLMQDEWIDERRDPYKATHAAVAYLKYLHTMFGDWQLVLAAYNAGEGKISRALNASSAVDFFDLLDKNGALKGKTQLRPETCEYVPRFLAVSKAMRNLSELGFIPPDFSQVPPLIPITVKAGTDLKKLAQQLGMSWEDFFTYNTAFKKSISPPYGPSQVYIPREKEFRALTWLSRPDSNIFAGWEAYKVERNDTIASLARRHSISQETLKLANNLKANSIATGTTLRVPANANVAKATVAVLPVETKTAAHKVYTVRRGETLSALASRWGTSVRSIEQTNSLKPKTALRIGQKLNIPGTARTATTATNTSSSISPQSKPVTISWTVKFGETLSGIARQTGTTTAELRKLNNLSASATIRIGQELIVKTQGGATSSSTTTASRNKPVAPSTVTVKAGDTLSRIAQSNNITIAELRRINSLSQSAHIKPGQVLKISGATSASTTVNTAPAARSAQASSRQASTRNKSYVVQSGDTLSNIAQRNSVRTTELLQANNLDKNAAIKPGQKLQIPPATLSSSGANNKKSTHVVQSGDTLYAVALRIGTDVKTLAKLNNIGIADSLRVGTELLLP